MTPAGPPPVGSTAAGAGLGIVLVALLALAVGCSVDSGGTEADQSTASTIPPDPTSPEASLPTAGLVLRADGLGVLAFGEPVDSALRVLTDAVGRQPTGDSMTTGEMTQGFGGTTVRFVGFGRLTVIFSDGAYYRDDGLMHFAGWGLSGSDPGGLGTPEGITPGSTVDQLRTAFGDQLHLDSEPSECDGRWHFSVGASALGLEGVLSGPSTDGSSSVTSLSAGAQSEC